MEIVNNIQHFSALIKEKKRRGKVILTNCYLMPEEISEYTQGQNMFSEEMDNGLIFLCRERDFYYLYFYLFQSDEQAVCTNLRKLEKPIVIDLVFSEKQQQAKLVEIECFWQDSGFNLHDTYSRMVLSSPPIIEQDLNIPPGYFLRHASVDNLKAIENVWQSSLDKYSTALPQKEKLARILDEGQVLAVFNEHDSVVAAMHVIIKGKVGLIKHVVVSEEKRNRGLAKVLLRANFLHYDRIGKWTLWVSDNNYPAKMFYLKSGFAFDGIISRQLLLN